MCLPMCAGFVITNIRITTAHKTKIPGVSFYVTHVGLRTTYLIFLLKAY